MYTKTYERLNECTVLMSPALLDLCKTHKGCPRGPMGVPMVLKQEKDDFASRIKGNCITKHIFYNIIKKYSSPRGDGNSLGSLSSVVKVHIKKYSSPRGDGNRNHFYRFIFPTY